MGSQTRNKNKPAPLLDFEQQRGAALSFLLALSLKALTFTAGRNIERDARPYRAR